MQSSSKEPHSAATSLLRDHRVASAQGQARFLGSRRFQQHIRHAPEYRIDCASRKPRRVLGRLGQGGSLRRDRRRRHRFGAAPGRASVRRRDPSGRPEGPCFESNCGREWLRNGGAPLMVEQVRQIRRRGACRRERGNAVTVGDARRPAAPLAGFALNRPGLRRMPERPQFRMRCEHLDRRRRSAPIARNGYTSIAFFCPCLSVDVLPIRARVGLAQPQLDPVRRHVCRPLRYRLGSVYVSASSSLKRMPPGGRTDTASGIEKPDGASHGAAPPHEHGRPVGGIPWTESRPSGGCGRHEVARVRERAGRAATGPAPVRADRSVPSACDPASVHTQGGRRGTTAGDRCAGRQDRPESGCGRHPDADLRGGVFWIQLWVPTRAGSA